MKKSFISLMAIILVAMGTHAQVGINTDGTSPDPSAMLDVKSIIKGFLAPRMTEAQRATVASPATGLLVYQTDGSAGFYFFNGTTWLWLGGDNHTGSGAANKVAFWDGIYSLTFSDYFHYDVATGRLGIGTSSPNEQLEITGNFRLPSVNTAGILFKGADLLLHNSGTSNTFLGVNSGNLAVTGQGNASFGTESMRYNSTGSYNIAIGYLALRSNTTCNNNVAVGYQALNGLYSGEGDENTYNIAIGSIALNDVQPSTSANGRRNIGIGHDALGTNTLGYDNTAIGHIALNNCIGGFQNTVIGSNANVRLSDQSNSIAIGYNAIAQSNDEIRLGNNSNTKFVCEAGKNATSSNPANLYVDPITGQIMQSTQNTIIGGGASGSVAFWIDPNTIGSNTNFFWDNSLERLGIGTFSPGQQLELTGSFRIPVTTSSTTGIIYKGTSSFIHDYQPLGVTGNNTFMGVNAGNFSMTGVGGEASNNTGIGNGALTSLTDGYSNTAVGASSLQSNITGIANTAIGNEALEYNTLAHYNTAMGSLALKNNTTAGNNTAIGYQTLYLQSYSNHGNFYGTDNVAIGYNSLYNNQPLSTTTGKSNTAVGVSSLENNTMGYDNTALGRSANVSTGNLHNVTVIGCGSIATANDQIRLGNSNITSFYCKGAYASDTTAPANMCVDATGKIKRSLASMLTGNGSAGQVAIWSGTGTLTSNPNFFWDNTNSRLGIGTSTPEEQLEITGNIRLSSNTDEGIIYKGTDPFISGYYNAFLGRKAGNLTMDGIYNVGIGVNALESNTSGQFNISIGTYALDSNQTCNGNIALGHHALYMQKNGHGDENTYNIAIGEGSMAGNDPTTSANGRNNLGIGAYALGSNTTGYHNTALGHDALFINTTGYKNTIIGSGAGNATNALINCIAIGYNAIAQSDNEIRLGTNTNTKLYCEAAKNSTSSSPANICIDPSTGQIMQSTANTVTGSGAPHCIAFWNVSGSLYYNSNFYWNNSMEQMGIGTSTPNVYSKLHVAHTSKYAGFFTSTYDNSETHIVHAECLGTTANNPIAMFGKSNTTSHYGIGGHFEGGQKGVEGIVNTSNGAYVHYGVYGKVSGGNYNNYGVYGESTGSGGGSFTCVGVFGNSTGNGTNYAVYGTASGGSTNYAGYFAGNVNITGTLTKGGGSFKIDHPQDPENKYLYHSFVESPDMKNVYDGIAILDASGEAVVELPGYFEALNKDFRYQLTAMGAPGPNLYIAEEVHQTHFKIAGGVSGMKVSWQVTGIRKDVFAEKNRVPVEVDKPDEERGKYLYPSAYGLPEERGIDYIKNGKVK